MRRALPAVIALAFLAAAPASAAPLLTGGPQVAALFRGIPQHGVELGRPSAPVTLVEFVDLQCPFCARWDRNALPTIVRKYVRPGKVRIVFSGLTVIGPGSLTALRTVLAAGRQNRLWNVVELLYLNQGRENSGWVTTPFLRRVGGMVAGLDVDRMLSDRRSAAVEAQRTAASSLAAAAGVRETPSFAAGRTNKSLRPFEVSALTAKATEAALDTLLRG
jgi:protein-disulfide isomerase